MNCKLFSMTALSFIVLSISSFAAEPAKLDITSPAFSQLGPIPLKYTCQGENISPPLTIAGIPKGTQSLALIVDDPDAPGGVYVHWLVWNIPPDKTTWEENLKVSSQGLNQHGTLGYSGPCPPPNQTHRYRFKLYALDKKLDPPEKATKEALEKCMEGHIIAKAELLGTYKRQQD